MSTQIKKVPDEYGSVVIYITVRNGSAAIDFYKRAFNAVEIGRLTMGNIIAHGEIQIGDTRIMLADEMPEWGNHSPLSLNGTSVGLCIYTEDADKMYDQAITAGATAIPGMEVKDQFYGDRSGTVLDPFGYKWTLATHIEDVDFNEMQKRMMAMPAPE